MESKVEKYIKAYTRNCSNEQGHSDLLHEKPIYCPWLTTDDAKSVTQIAREEVIEESAEWMKLYILNHDIIDIFEMETEYKKYMEG